MSQERECHHLISGLSPSQAALKRSFDIFGAVLGLSFTFWIIAIAWAVSALDTKANGFFMQERVGLNRRRFKVIKIRTMRLDPSMDTTVTTSADVRITQIGRFLRRTKIDELPQLFNVLMGEMSFVGPRPDVPGYADRLIGENQVLLSIRPGITGPATLKYKNEERLLAAQQDPEKYNDNIIYPDKVRINVNYVKNWCLINDIKYIFRTIIS